MRIVERAMNRIMMRIFNATITNADIRKSLFWGERAIIGGFLILGMLENFEGRTDRQTYRRTDGPGYICSEGGSKKINV